MMDAKAQLQAEADEWERTIATSADSSVRSARTGECRRMVGGHRKGRQLSAQRGKMQAIGGIGKEGGKNRGIETAVKTRGGEGGGGGVGAHDRHKCRQLSAQ